VIGARGEFVKKYNKLKLFSAIKDRKYTNTIELEMMHETVGCLKTQNMSGNRGRLEVTNMVDKIEWIKTTMLELAGLTTVTRGHGEWPFFSACIGENPCGGSYSFEDNKLRMSGGISNNAYMNLEKVTP
jgi:hypothetical protein